MPCGPAYPPEHTFRYFGNGGQPRRATFLSPSRQIWTRLGESRRRRPFAKKVAKKGKQEIRNRAPRSKNLQRKWVSSVSLLKVGKSPRGGSFRVSRGFLPFSSFFAAIRSVLSAIFGLPRLYFLVKVWVKRDCVSFKRIAREGGGEEVSFSLLFLFAPLKTRLPERGKGGSFTLIFVPPLLSPFSLSSRTREKMGPFCSS